jgi:hypothetical protein
MLSRFDSLARRYVGMGAAKTPDNRGDCRVLSKPIWDREAAMSWRRSNFFQAYWCGRRTGMNLSNAEVNGIQFTKTKSVNPPSGIFDHDLDAQPRRRIPTPDDPPNEYQRLVVNP